MDERRQTVQLINHWNKVKCTSKMPIIESFQTQLFSNRLLDSMVIFTRNNLNCNNYHIEFMGINIIDMTRIIDDSSKSPLVKMMDKILIIAKKSISVIDQGDFIDVEKKLVNIDHVYFHSVKAR